MAITAFIGISGTITGTLSGTESLAASVSIASGVVPQTTQVTLGNGANTVTVPANANGFLFTPASGNSQTLTLKGVSGDTGIALHPTNPLLLFFPASPPASLVITAGGATTGLSEFRFF